jgi:lipid-A-disaccharide synthase
MMTEEKTIFICAGESSADRYAAEIIHAAKKRQAQLRFIGVGSEYAKKAGMTVYLDISAYSTVGLVESLRYVWPLLKAYRTIKRLLREHKPDIFLAIDNQGFNMLCCKAAKALGIQVYYYIAPQEWQWGTDKGGEKVLALVDKVLAIFPEEQAFYSRLGGKSVFVGHPVIDRVRPFQTVNQRDKLLTLFPGSRRAEIDRLLPLFLDCAHAFRQNHSYEIIVSIASSQYKDLIIGIIKQSGYESFVKTDSSDSLSLMSKATVSLVTSGTVSLEHALLGIPHVVAYKFSPLTYFILNRIMTRIKERVKYMSMANMLMNTRLFPEFLQNNATKNSILEALEQLIQETTKNTIKEKTQRLYKSLDQGLVSERIVEELLKEN